VVAVAVEALDLEAVQVAAEMRQQMATAQAAQQTLAVAAVDLLIQPVTQLEQADPVVRELSS
jgi:hypothetical protein